MSVITPYSRAFPVLTANPDVDWGTSLNVGDGNEVEVGLIYKWERPSWVPDMERAMEAAGFVRVSEWGSEPTARRVNGVAEYARFDYRGAK